MPGWGEEGWGDFPWGEEELGGDLAAYFMPDASASLMPQRHDEGHRKFRKVGKLNVASVQYEQGTELVISGTTYHGGRWNGPLTTAQVAAIEAAGHGSRIFYSRPDMSGLPSDVP